MLQFKGAGEAQMRHQDIMRCIVKRWEVCQYKKSSYSRQFRTRFLCFIAIVRFLFMDNLMPYLLWLHLWSSNKILEQVYFIFLLFYIDNLYHIFSLSVPMSETIREQIILIFLSNMFLLSVLSTIFFISPPEFYYYLMNIV